MRAHIAFLAVFALPGTLMAQVKFTSPTPDELKMTSEPKAPNAPAVILSYDEDDDPNSAEVIVHVRIKVLTTGGVDAGTVEIPQRLAEQETEDFRTAFAARTIHPDGSIIPFTGTPQNSKTVDGFYGKRKVLALPSVTVGSIIEYGYHLQSENNIFTYLVGYYTPVWRVQRDYFVRNAHFVLRFPEPRDESTWSTNYDKDSVCWVANLPKGAEIKPGRGRFELSLQDVPAASAEEFMPPPTAAFYNVRFFYYNKGYKKGDDRYWGESGSRVDDRWHAFDKPSKLLKEAVTDITLATDNDAARLRKLYLAVQKLDNTDLSREHSEREDKAQGLKTSHNADTIWTNKRGSSDELALLFVALARSAGYAAYPMAVASRNYEVFDQNVLSWDQMNDIIAIVNVDGKDMYFDPGTRLCPFARLAAWHANVMGVSTEAKVVKIRSTPSGDPQATRTERAADFAIASNGQVKGTIEVAWIGTAGLTLRRQSIREDAHAVETGVEEEMQHQVPSGVIVKLDSLKGLGDSEIPLVASFTISGRLGAATSKRLILPAQFFAGSAKPILTSETRTQPIAFPEAYTMHDRVFVRLPAEAKVEALPNARKMVLTGGSGLYEEQTQAGAMKDAPAQKILLMQRTMQMTGLDFKAVDYEPLHKYFGAIATADSEQITLQLTPAAGSGTSGGPGAEPATSPAPPSPSR